MRLGALRQRTPTPRATPSGKVSQLLRNISFPTMLLYASGAIRPFSKVRCLVVRALSMETDHLKPTAPQWRQVPRSNNHFLQNFSDQLGQGESPQQRRRLRAGVLTAAGHTRTPHLRPPSHFFFFFYAKIHSSFAEHLHGRIHVILAAGARSLHPMVVTASAPLGRWRRPLCTDKFLFFLSSYAKQDLSSFWILAFPWRACRTISNRPRRASVFSLGGTTP